jgi:hypothetical protein
MSLRIIENSTAKGFKALADRLKAGEFYVKVGVPDDPAVNEAGEASHEVTLGDTARWLEFGTPTAPERPIFRNGIRNSIGELQRLGKVNLLLISQGQMTVDRVLGLMGALAAGRIKQEFGSSELAPNAPSTIERKGSSRPGIDTAQTKNSVTWEVIGHD